MTDALIVLLVVHFVADFMLQSNWMAMGKSKQWGFNKNMATHIGIYTLCLAPFGWVFACVNGLVHFIVDAFTSRATAYLWKREERHAFFVVIGFDQLLHTLTLLLTYQLLT